MIAIVSGLVFATIVGWLHVRRRDIRPGTEGVSHYAVGPTHAPMTVAFLALALAIGSVSSSIATRAGGIAANIGTVLLWLAAFGIAVVAVVPIPEPAAARWRGPVHTIGALLFFVASSAGPIAVSRQFGGAILGAACLLAGTTVLFLAGMVRAPGLFAIRGWLQRCCFALVVAWVILVARRLELAI